MEHRFLGRKYVVIPSFPKVRGGGKEAPCYGLEYLFFTCSLQAMDYGKTLRSHALPPAQEHPRWRSLPSHHQAPGGFEGAMLMSVCQFRSNRRRRSRARGTLLALQSSGPNVTALARCHRCGRAAQARFNLLPERVRQIDMAIPAWFTFSHI